MSKAGYAPATRAVEVPAGGRLQVTVPLFANAAVGGGVVKTVTGGAERAAAGGVSASIRYGLSGPAPAYTISLRYRRGATGAWAAIPADRLQEEGSTALGAGVAPGLHYLTWDVGGQLPSINEPAMQVEVTVTGGGASHSKASPPFPVDTRAAAATATLTGRLVKTTGGTLAGGVIRLLPIDLRATSGADGTFSIPSVPLGRGYAVRIGAAGYQPKSVARTDVTATSLALGDIALTPETQAALVRPLDPAVNPPVLVIPTGGAGYLYYRVQRSDGILACPGCPVTLQKDNGTALTQEPTPREGWAGRVAGISDADGVVRLSIPASEIGAAGSRGYVTVAITAASVPDRVNFPNTGGKDRFAVLVIVSNEVAPLEKILGLEATLEGEANAGHHIGAALSNITEQRNSYAGGILRHETVSSRTSGRFSYGFGVGTPKFDSPAAVVVFSAQGSATVDLGAFGSHAYEFPATATSGRDKAFKLYSSLMGSAKVFAPPVLGTAFVEFMNGSVAPLYAPWRESVAGGISVAGRVQGSMDVSLGNGARKVADISAGASGEVGVEFAVESARRGLSGSTEVFLDLSASSSGGLKLPFLEAEVSAGGILGIFGSAWGEIGTNWVGLTTAMERITGSGLRSYAMEFEGTGRNGATLPLATQLALASPAALFGRQIINGLSERNDAIVSYTRREAVGSVDNSLGSELTLPIPGFDVEISGELQGRRVAERPVETGVLRKGVPFPSWTMTAPTASDVPSGTMLGVMASWAVEGDFGALFKDAYEAKKLTIQTSIVTFWNKLTGAGKRAVRDVRPAATTEAWAYGWSAGIAEVSTPGTMTAAIAVPFNYAAADLGGRPATDIGAYFFNAASGHWLAVPFTLNTATTTVTATAEREGFYALALTQPGGAISLVMDYGSGDLPADGTTTVPVRATGLLNNNGTQVANGTLYTVEGENLTILTADASATVAGNQVSATNGVASVSVRAPAGGVTARVTMRSVSGNAVGQVEIPLGDSTAPAVPAGLAVTQQPGAVLHTAWTAATAIDLRGYRAYFRQSSAGPPWEGVASVEGLTSPVFSAENTLDLAGMDAGQTWFVAVSAVDLAGNESALSAPVSRTVSLQAPAAPANARAIKGQSGRVFLSWALSVDDMSGQRNVTGYTILRRILPGGAWTSIGTALFGEGSYAEPWPAGLTTIQYPEYAIQATQATGPASAQSLVSAQTQGATDSDFDGMPDAWESSVGLNPLNPSDAAGNADGDLRTNVEEYLAGSHPARSDGSEFLITQVATATAAGSATRLADPGTIRLTWNAEAALAAGESYGIEASTSLTSAPWEVVTDAVITVSGRVGVAVIGVLRENPKEFFRVRILGRVAAPPGFSLIPAGTFTMGDQSNPLVGDSDEVPVHSVTLSAFYMAKTEVTWAQWQASYSYGTANGYAFDNAGAGKATDHPVQMVSWYDVVKWCNAKSQQDGLQPCYTVSGATYKTGQQSGVGCDFARNGYRLPTEAEWEKAARGGKTGLNFPWGNTITHSQANYYSSTSSSYDISPTRGYHPTYGVGSTPYTSPVGAFTGNANGYGLFDMTGNVWEWCWDWYGSYAAGAASDPRGPNGGSDRVFRGGSWYYVARYCRSTLRFNYNPTGGNYDVGFRLARGSL